MLNSNTLNWNQVKADFGDTNTAINTAIGGFSKAGDVFTKMRDRLAAEEQQDIENQYKQDVLNESIRATDLADADRDEDRSLNEKFRRDQLAQQAKDAAAARGLQARGIKIQEDTYNQTLEDNKRLDWIVNTALTGGKLFSDWKDQEKTYNTLQAKRSAGTVLTPEEQKQYDKSDAARRAWEEAKLPETFNTATGRLQWAIGQAGHLSKFIPQQLYNDAKNEYDRSLAHDKASKEEISKARTFLQNGIGTQFAPGAAGPVYTAFEYFTEKGYNPWQVASMLNSIDPVSFSYGLGNNMKESNEIADNVVELFKNFGIKSDDLKGLYEKLGVNFNKSSFDDDNNKSNSDVASTATPSSLGLLLFGGSSPNSSQSDKATEKDSGKNDDNSSISWDQFIKSGFTDNDSYRSLYNFYKENIEPPTQKYLEELEKIRNMPIGPSSDFDEDWITRELTRRVLENSGQLPISIAPDVNSGVYVNFNDVRQRLMNPNIQTRNYRPGESLRIDQFGNPAAIRWNPIK